MTEAIVFLAFTVFVSAAMICYRLEKVIEEMQQANREADVANEWRRNGRMLGERLVGALEKLDVR